MSALLAWFLAGLASVAGYVLLALDGQSFWESLPFLAVIAVAIFVCGTAGARRARGSHD